MQGYSVFEHSAHRVRTMFILENSLNIFQLFAQHEHPKLKIQRNFFDQIENSKQSVDLKMSASST